MAVKEESTKKMTECYITEPKKKNVFKEEELGISNFTSKIR